MEAPFVPNSLFNELEHYAFNPASGGLNQEAFPVNHTSHIRTPAPKSSPVKAPEIRFHNEALPLVNPKLWLKRTEHILITV